VSRSIRILLIAVVAVAAVGGYWKFLLAPKREEVSRLDSEIATVQAQLAQTQTLIATYKGARDAYEANYAAVVRLGKAVPADDDTRSLIVQLDAAAKRSGVDFDSINVNASGASSAAGPSGTAPTLNVPGAVNAGAFSAMPFTLTFTGTFATLGDFLSRLERLVTLRNDQIKVNGRLLRVESIALQPSPEGWPSLGIQVGASSYIVPEPQEAAAAEAAASTGTTTASTTAEGSDAR
jgi:Tfp pilus assembly protein PilO